MTAKKWIINDWGEEWLSKEWQAGDVIDALQQFASLKVAEVTKGMYPRSFVEWIGENEFYKVKGKRGKWIFQTEPYVIWKSTDELFEYWKENVNK